MRSPMDQMIDALVSCVKCGARAGQCNCWMPMRCPNCGRKKITERTPDVPHSAVRLELTCPDCTKDMPDKIYYDAEGKVCEEQ